MTDTELSAIAPDQRIGDARRDRDAERVVEEREEQILSEVRAEVSIRSTLKMDRS